MGKRERRVPADGMCCGCGYSGEEETACAEREDGVHCVHWWDGDGSECKHGSPACSDCRQLNDDKPAP